MKKAFAVLGLSAGLLIFSGCGNDDGYIGSSGGEYPGSDSKSENITVHLLRDGKVFETGTIEKSYSGWKINVKWEKEHQEDRSITAQAAGVLPDAVMAAYDAFGIITPITILFQNKDFSPTAIADEYPGQREVRKQNVDRGDTVEIDTSDMNYIVNLIKNAIAANSGFTEMPITISGYADTSSGVVKVDKYSGHDNLLSKEWTTGGENGTGAWTEVVYGKGYLEYFEVEIGKVSWMASVPKNDLSLSNDLQYSGAYFAVYFEKGFLTENKKITITYSSDYLLHLELIDNVNDAMYYAPLPVGDNVTVTFDLSSHGGKWNDNGYALSSPNLSGNHFRQPEWAGSYNVYNLDVSKVEALAFSIPADDESDNTAYAVITKLLVERAF